MAHNAAALREIVARVDDLAVVRKAFRHASPAISLDDAIAAFGGDKERCVEVLGKQESEQLVLLSRAADDARADEIAELLDAPLFAELLRQSSVARSNSRAAFQIACLVHNERSVRHMSRRLRIQPTEDEYGAIAYAVATAGSSVTNLVEYVPRRVVVVGGRRRRVVVVGGGGGGGHRRVASSSSSSSRRRPLLTSDDACLVT